MKQWYFPLARVEQDDNYGCAIASVATVCGVTYGRARAEFFPKRRDFDDNRTLCVRGHHMLRVIHKLGFKAHFHHGTYGHFRCPVLVPFAWFPPDPNWIHCVVWDPFGEEYIDPGPDHNDPAPNNRYTKLWRKSNFRVIVVTGKR